ncbi:MAG TPA: hypothetical protein VFB12_04710 [Ktedonobacteraceae bacterium]|nr:hypothetical protein [Ktedonobacteraceae bacterium]
MTERYSVIDVHHHLIFPQMRAALRAQFESSDATMLFPEWSLQSDREAMERFNVTGALLSLPISGTPE